jgi:FkbM family methyltransferase
MMQLLTHLTARAHRLARYLDEPRLFVLRKRDSCIDHYEHFAQPWILARQFNTILDIGANRGQFATIARLAFPHAQIYSFEPLPDCYAQMVANLREDTRFQAFQVALGDEVGAKEFERNDFTQSSSLLTMTDLHRTAFPVSKKAERTVVQVDRLDSFETKLNLVEPVLAKLDVQGYEDQVIRGGQAVLRRAAMIISELSFEPLYAGQLLFDDIMAMLSDLGFRFAGALDQLRHPQDGRVLQMDGVFVRA